MLCASYVKMYVYLATFCENAAQAGMCLSPFIALL